jgi:hypothetical protein
MYSAKWRKIVRGAARVENTFRVKSQSVYTSSDGVRTLNLRAVNRVNMKFASMCVICFHVRNVQDKLQIHALAIVGHVPEAEPLPLPFPIEQRCTSVRVYVLLVRVMCVCIVLLVQLQCEVNLRYIRQMSAAHCHTLIHTRVKVGTCKMQ